MTATLAPFGFQPTRSGLNGSAVGQEGYDIASAYATGIFTNDPVVLFTDGTLNAAGNTSNGLFGMFQGCEYTDSSNVFQIKANWIASQALYSGTLALGYVIRNPFAEYFVQNAGSVATTRVGDMANMVLGSGNLTQGTSTSTLSSSWSGSGGSQAQFRCVGLAKLQNNAFADAYTIVRVVINQLTGFWPGSTVL